MKKYAIRLALILISAALMAACSTQTPFVVIVTPTHPAVTAPGISALPTSLSATPIPLTPIPVTPTPLLTQSLSPTTTIAANITFGAVSGTLIPAATAMPSGTAAPVLTGSETVTATFGAVIGPNLHAADTDHAQRDDSRHARDPYGGSHHARTVSYAAARPE